MNQVINIKSTLLAMEEKAVRNDQYLLDLLKTLPAEDQKEYLPMVQASMAETERLLKAIK